MIELEVVPACRHYGLGLIPWSPLAGGLLGGTLRKVQAGRRLGDESVKQAAKNRSRLERYEALCTELGEEPGTVALAWLLHNPAVTAPIVGPRTLEQLESAVRATEIALSADVLARLDEIFPGPGGEAPWAYAW
jgi:aryl-alcohol dehydrogenase-like predicted oxidoreductase